jgi:hypothetical protein
MAQIKDGKEYVRDGVADAGAATIIDLRRKAGMFLPDPAAGAPTGAAVLARLNHGRWIGDCNLWDESQNRTCLNAQFLDEGDKRFWCVECFNVANTGRWRPVTWPASRATVEAPLADLPAPEQNWEP